MCAFSELSLTASIAADQATRLSLLLLRSTLLTEAASTRHCCFLHHSLQLHQLHCKGVSVVSGGEKPIFYSGCRSPDLLWQSSLLLPNLAGQILSPSQMFWLLFIHNLNPPAGEGGRGLHDWVVLHGEKWCSSGRPLVLTWSPHHIMTSDPAFLFHKFPSSSHRFKRSHHLGCRWVNHEQQAGEMSTLKVEEESQKGKAPE